LHLGNEVLNAKEDERDIVIEKETGKFIIKDIDDSSDEDKAKKTQLKRKREEAFGKGKDKDDSDSSDD
jgi:hypothetical protein